MEAEAGFLSVVIYLRVGSLCMHTFIGLEAAASEHYKLKLDLANFTSVYYIGEEDRNQSL